MLFYFFCCLASFVFLWLKDSRAVAIADARSPQRESGNFFYYVVLPFILVPFMIIGIIISLVGKIYDR